VADEVDAAMELVEPFASEPPQDLIGTDAGM
jgi:hypothetical protein